MTERTLPEFDTFGTRTINAREKPDEANAAIQAVLTEDKTSGRPVIDPPPENHLTLERGIIRDDIWYREAEVRELNGEDEEAIAAAGKNAFRSFETILVRGVRRIGNEAMTRKLAGELLMGDRELLVLAIRRATFGDELRFERLPCAHCDELTDLTLPLSEIAMVHLRDPEQIEYPVPLRHGATAYVRLPTGADQSAVLNLKDANVARQNTEMLSRCLLCVEHRDGDTETGPGTARRLSMADRQTLLEFFIETQPGPRYNDVTWIHDACGQEVPLPITLALLFRGM